MTATAELLERHRPVVRYDSQESYFADSAAEWTDNPGNRLTRADGTAIAVAGHGLGLAFLGTSYPDGSVAAATDAICSPAQDYRERARALHERPEYRNQFYGHAVLDGAGDLWLQYWFFYFYNDYNLIGHVLGAGLHEGDWETVQLQLRDEAPVRAVYAQHTAARASDWPGVELAPGTQRPIVYVARGSHACYFKPGRHWTGHWFDHADGKRASPELELNVVVDGEHEWRWVRWPGTWGDTKPGENPLDSPSPPGPGAHEQWDEPLALVERTHARAAAAGALPSPPPPPHIRAEWADGRIRVLYDALPAPDGEEAAGLAITINSPDEHAPPTTEAFEIATRTGAVTVSAAADPSHRYDIHASSATVAGLASDSVRADLSPISPSGA